MKLRIFLILANGLLIQLAYADGVSRQDWSDMMATILPPAFCRDGSYFRQCFHLERENCEKAALSATKACLTRLEELIPATVTSKEQSVQAGRLVGQCAGASVEMRFLPQKSREDKCADASNWK